MTFLQTALLRTLLLLCIVCLALPHPAGAQSYIINTVAGNGTPAFAGDGAAATSASFQNPSGVAVDASGNIYIADLSNNRIRKVTVATGIITTVAGTSTGGPAGDGGPATSAQLSVPYGVALDAAGNLYIADRANHRVRKVTMATGIITTVAGSGTQGFGGDGGLATAALLNEPTGMAFDAAGNMYIADFNNNRIRKVTLATGIISTVAGNGTYAFTGDGGLATSASFRTPTSVALDATGNMYISDYGSYRVRKVAASTGIINTVAGNGTQGFGGDGSAATGASLSSAVDVKPDAAGNLYITDGSNHRIRKVSAATGIITTIAGNGTGGFAGDGGVATSGSINNATGIAQDAAGSFYIAELVGHRIRKLTLNNIGLNFSGGGNYVQSAASTGITGAQPRTTEMWVKLNAGSLASGANNFLFSSGSFSGFAQGFGLYANNGTLYFSIGNFAVSTFYTIDAAWHYVAEVYDGISILLYVDGTLVYTYTPGYGLLSANSVLYLGTSYGNSQYLGGTLDEVRLWNRALCPAEILNNMNGELPNPAAQTGLILYYTFDQGVAGGTNTGLTTLTDGSVTGNNGTLMNFNLSGTSSNYVAGTPAITGLSPAYTPATATATESVTKAISGTAPIIVYGCGALLSITPTGGNALSGSTVFRVTRDASVQTTTNGNTAYAQRHYDIEPAANAAIATANVTLYYTQAEFIAFNNARGSLPSLPVDPADAANNKANVRITQYHGVPTGSNVPANYPGGGANHVLITPASVAYNSTTARWEVTFPVSGFSGFFLSTNSNAPLPLKLLSFSAQKTSGRANRIGWATAQEGSGTTFEITRSGNGAGFEQLATVAGKGSNSSYSWDDEQPLSSVNYYRLKISEVGGAVSYSNTAIVRAGSNGGVVTITPVPAHNSLTISNTDAGLIGRDVAVTDMKGQTVMHFKMAAVSEIDISALTAGLYCLRLPSGEVVRIVKQ